MLIYDMFSNLLDAYQKKKIQPQANVTFIFARCVISVDKLRTRCVGALSRVTTFTSVSLEDYETVAI